MQKTTALFQLVTEILLIGLFAICLTPSTLIINIDVWGAKMDLNVKDMLCLSDPLSTFFLIASMTLFFIVVLFSLTTKEGKRVRSLNAIRPYRVRRKKSHQPKGNTLTKELNQPKR